MKNNVIDVIAGLIIRLFIFIILAGISIITLMFFEVIPNPFVAQMDRIEADINDGITDIIDKVKENDDFQEEIPKGEAPVLSVDVIDSTQQVQSNQPIIKDYYYNQIEERSKIIYNKIIENEDTLFSGKDTIVIGTMFSKDMETDEGADQIIECVKEAIKAVNYDRQNLFYLEVSKMEVYIVQKRKGISVTNQLELRLSPNEISYFADGFTSKEQVKQAQTQFENKVDQIIRPIKNQTTYEKVKYVHDWLVDNVEYDSSGINSHNAYGAIIEGRAVCDGYARALRYMLGKLDVTIMFAAGNATNSTGQTEAHAWNYVKMDDGQWYAIDITWDDPIIKGGGTVSKDFKYDYFLKGIKFKENHYDSEFFMTGDKKMDLPRIAQKDY